MNARISLGVAALVAVVSLSGCALSNVGSDFAPDERGDAGVMVVSLGRTGAAEFDLYALIKPVGGLWPYTVVVNDRVATEDFGKVVIPPPGSPASDWGYVPSTSPLERLVVAALPSGEYEIRSISGAPPFVSKGTPFLLHSDRFAMRFRVQPGRVTYLGSIVFAFPDWLPLSHYSGPLRVVAADARERDGKLLRARYPKLSTDLPERSLTDIPDPSHVYRYYLLTVRGGGSSRK